MQMSSKSLKQSPMSSKCSEIPPNRSISDIVKTLKTSFLDSDYKAAVKELMSREEGLRREKEMIVASLREKCDALEGESGELKLQKYMWEEERRRLTRDCEVNDDKMKELTRELSLVKEKEANAIKRYDRLHNEIRDMEKREVKLIEMLSDSRDMVEELKRKLREKEEEVEEFVGKDAEFNAQLEELEEVKRRNVCLEEEKLKYDARLEELKREKDERIKELLNKNVAEKSQIEAQLEAQRVELEDAVRKNAYLEEQKDKVSAQVEELRRNVGEKDKEIKRLSEDILCLERVKNDTVKEKDAKILELVKDRESLDVENRKLTANLGEVKESFLKLERDVISCMCFDLGKDKRFASSHVGKILSGIMKVLDSEEIGLTCSAGVEKDGNIQEADSAFVSHVNEPKRCLNSGKQSVEAVKRQLDFKEEFPRNDGAIDNEKNASPTIVIPIDSDDDNDNIPHVMGVNKKRKCSGSMIELLDDDDSVDNNLNSKHKMKKSEHVLCEQVKQEPSLVASPGARNDHKFNTYQRETLATIRKCEEKLMKEVGESRYTFLEDNGSKGDDSKYNCATPKKSMKEVENYRTSLRQRKQNKILVCRADMICALDQDDDFCAKALCALYRQQKSLSSGMNGSELERSKGLVECDFKRVATLAEFLIDGDPLDKLKKSVAELQQHDPEGLKDCRQLARKYSNNLIDIYTKKGDPLFSPFSSDLQYM